MPNIRIGRIPGGRRVFRSFLLVAVSLSTLVSATVSLANTSTTYQYDAQGRVILVTYSDGTAIGYSYDSAGNRYQQVISGNHPPVANPDSVTTSYQSPKNFDPRVNDTDSSNNPLTIASVGTPSNGTAVINSGISVTYTPNSSFIGTDTFPYSISDGHGNVASANITVTVNAPNAPTQGDRLLAGQALLTSHNLVSSGGAYTLAMQSDGNLVIYGPGRALWSSNTSGTSANMLVMQANGNLVLSGTSGQVLWNTGTTGNSGASMIMQTDGNLVVYNSASQAVWNSGTGEVPPVANTDSYTINQNNQLVANPTQNDTDANGDPLTITGVGAASHGTTSFTSSSVTYTPNTNYNGSDFFTYSISDGRGGTASATINISFSPVPIANGATLPVGYNSTGSVTVTESGSWTSSAISSNPSHGTASISGLSATYTPTSGYYGLDSFTYTITGPTGTSLPGTVSVTVANPPAPSVGGVSLSSTYNGSGSTPLAPSGVYTSLSMASNPTHGSASISGTTATYTPSSGYYGADSFTYKATGPGGTSSAGTVAVTVANPPAPSVGAASLTVAYNTAGSVGLSPSGVYSSLSVASAPSHGSASITGTTATYTPTSGYSGADNFTYTANGPGGTSSPANVSVTVQAPVSPPPVCNTFTYTFPIPTNAPPQPVSISAANFFTANCSSSSGYTLTVTSPALPLNFTIAHGQSLPYSYSVSDGHGGTASATVTFKRQ